MKQFSYKKIGIIFLLLFQLSLIEVFAQTPSKTELEYFTIENIPLYIINTNDINLAIRYKKGQGTPIVFIHGSWDDHNSWLP
ncbi:alpha/beta hydrolase, partial [Myroides odoratimimus]|nr:alpha/beta hydrolase [Myroides odoratimimus]